MALWMLDGQERAVPHPFMRSIDKEQQRLARGQAGNLPASFLNFLLHPSGSLRPLSRSYRRDGLEQAANEGFGASISKSLLKGCGEALLDAGKGRRGSIDERQRVPTERASSDRRSSRVLDDGLGERDEGQAWQST